MVAVVFRFNLPIELVNWIFQFKINWLNFMFQCNLKYQRGPFKYSNIKFHAVKLILRGPRYGFN